jgi:hypothetical protein
MNYRTPIRAQIMSTVLLSVILLGIIGLLAFGKEFRAKLNNSTITSVNQFVVDIGGGRFLTDPMTGDNLDISGHVFDAPLLSTLLTESARIDGRWTVVRYDGRDLLQRTTNFAGLRLVEYYKVDQPLWFGEQTFRCESLPHGVSPAQDGQVGSVLIVTSLQVSRHGENFVLMSHYVRRPAESTADLEAACPE